MVEKQQAMADEEIKTAETSNVENKLENRIAAVDFFKAHKEAITVFLCSVCIFASCIINITADKQAHVIQVNTDVENADANTAQPVGGERVEDAQENDALDNIITDENGNRPFLRPEGIAPSVLDETKIDPQFPSDISKALKVNMVTSDKKTAYITFDDGPSENTQQILDILKKYGVKATFFVLGEKAQMRPDLVLRIFNEGHTVANHTYSHEYDTVYQSPEVLREEIYKTEDIIASIIGRKNVMKLFRFPGGSMNKRQSEMRADFEQFGYKYADWNALNGDAEMADYTYDHCIARIKETCSDTGDVVILMHDAATKQMTAAALPETIEYLISQGYSFERIVP